MSEPTEPVPPTSAAPIGTEHGTVRYSVPETTRLLGISERAVRKRITAGSLDAHKEGNAWVVLLPATKGAVPAAPAAQETVPEAAPVSGTATSDVHEAVIQLRTLLAEERQRADSYLEASTIWQGRALQLEERLKALEAGPIAGDVDQAAGRIHESGHQPSPVAAEAAETTRPAWRRWWRRMTGSAVDLS